MSEIVVWRNLQHPMMAPAIGFGTNAQITLSTTSSLVAIPIDLPRAEEIDFFEVYLNTGESTAFRCRIVTVDAATGLDTSTLAHANADLSITATSGAWNKFDFTNFTLAAGSYWLLLDSTATPGTALAIQHNQDYDGLANTSAGRSVNYWTGSAMASVSVSLRSIRGRMKSASGWMEHFPLAPLGGASGINGLILDTLENPACRGNRFIAPFSGKISAFDVSIGLSSTRSMVFVFATEECASELARVEDFQSAGNSTAFTRKIRFPEVTVVAGTSYDCYVTAGSLATTTTGANMSALDTSEDSGNVIACYGVTPGDILGLYVNDPPTEGGSDTPTTTADHVFPWVPIYSEITTSGGSGGGETSHVFAA